MDLASQGQSLLKENNHDDATFDAGFDATFDASFSLHNVKIIDTQNHVTNSFL